ncbi:MAG: ABC transporter substrate-binding protein [Thermofilum sp.]
MSGRTLRGYAGWIAALIAALFLGYMLGALLQAAPPRQSEGTVEVPLGALLPLTGDLASFGKRERQALELAVRDVNDFASRVGSPYRFRLIVEDTRGDPEVARSKIQVLFAQGVRAVVGPLSSSEVSAVKQFADSNEIVVVSQGSTSVALAIPGDYVFRLVPTDKFQGRVLAELIWHLGYRKAAVIYRNDAWGQGLFSSFKQNFESLGGRAEGVAYDPRAQDLSAEVARLADITSGFGSPTAVIMISFEDDGVNIIRLMSRNPVFSGVVLFGTDGSALSSKFIEEVGEEILKFGGNPSTNYVPASNQLQQNFIRVYRSLYGENPDVYSMNAYDAVWLIALSVILTGSYDGEIIARTLPLVAQHYYGVTGYIPLDENGDRAYGDYGIFEVRRGPEGLQWVMTAIYEITSGRLLPVNATSGV